ncbi:MAG: AP endonuclease [Epulopiscium sp. Nele67-Bin004]|nr:MAG: AP endonuclease [Epulopiscium sp. Nele67-Bin004]
MKLSTSTNLVCERPDGTVFPLEKTLEYGKRAGFRRFDISFWDWSLPHSPFITDKWEDWAYSVANKATELGVEFGQCHAYTFDFLDSNLKEEEYAYHQMLVERSLQCCHMWGSKLCVSHPSTDFNAVDLVKTSKAQNIEYFKKLLDISTKYNIALAIENMCDYSIAPKRKYCATPEELVDFVTEFNDNRIGICWDVEHADIMQQNQRASLLYINKHLKATHISDTHSKTDTDLMHVLPLFGTIDFKEVVTTLRAINYRGDFSFEAHNYANRLPDDVLETALKLTYEIGQYLMQL